MTAPALSLAVVVLLAVANPSTPGVFEGRTPCGAIANRFTGFPSEGCEKIKWRLTLRHDPSGAPTTYLYEGTRTSHPGRWRITTPAPGRTVIVLTPDDDRPPLSLLNLEDKVLLLLDANGQVLPGDASWSYALNRIPRSAH
jgi:hypothetical protein